VLTDAQGTPLAVAVDAASAAEGPMGLAVLLAAWSLLPIPEGTRVLADKAYDDDWLREECADLDLVLVARHRKNRKKAKTSDGRSERRLCRRWKIERTNAWLHSYRRALTRYEKSIRRYEGFVSLACAFVALGKLVRDDVVK
jgi:transposase